MEIEWFIFYQLILKNINFFVKCHLTLFKLAYTQALSRLCTHF